MKSEDGETPRDRAAIAEACGRVLEAIMKAEYYGIVEVCCLNGALRFNLPSLAEMDESGFKQLVEKALAGKAKKARRKALTKRRK